MKALIKTAIVLAAFSGMSVAIAAETASQTIPTKPPLPTSTQSKPVVMTQAQLEEQAIKDVEAALDLWLKDVSIGNSSEVIQLYAPDAVLIPTLSGKLHNTEALRKEYFDHFTALKKLKGKVDELQTSVFHNQVGVNSGLYTFTYEKDGKEVSVPARFTFVYEKTPRGWMIVEHHSSKKPD